MRRTLIVAVLLVAVALGAIGTLTVDSQTDESIEVRISAQRLEDGRTEFGLQQRTANGWSDRILPRGRYFPADAESGRWLNSTPVSVGDTGFQPIDIGAIAYSQPAPSDDDLWFATNRDEAGLTTWVGIDLPLSGRTRYTSVALVIGCHLGEIFVDLWVGGSFADYEQFGVAEYDIGTQVTYRFSGPYEAVTASWSLSVTENAQVLNLPAHLVDRFMSRIRENRSLEASFNARQFLPYREDVRMSPTFHNSRRLLSTYVQPNLDRCGEY